jgi:Rps23 Pro-64 3,4-dihydroxylase Tpa1-like proline 4-hydroxylase
MNIFQPQMFDEARIAQLRKEFDEAKPYRHLVIDNFLQASFASDLNAHFPSVEALKIHWKGLNENKFEGSEFENFHPRFKELKEAMFSEALSKWVTQVTGIEDVFITDDSLGAGIHQGANGSFLDIHIDFNIHHIKNVHRRLNLLIYLEKNWKDEYGGHLEMWDAQMTKCEKKVKPEFNRCVIFETNEISYHGYGKITLPEGVTRKSFFSYFYTNEREGATGYHDTIFKARPEEGAVKKIQTDVKETLKNTAKATLKKIGIKF